LSPPNPRDLNEQVFLSVMPSKDFDELLKDDDDVRKLERL